MSDKKISQLDPAAALDGTELLAVVQSGTTLRSAVSTVKTYLDAFYQPLDADLTSIAALGYASTSFLKKTGANTWALDTNTYQVSNANLTSLSALSYVSGSFVKMTGANTFSLDTSTYLTTIGTGVANELTYWDTTSTIGSLATATYPSLTEVSYVKGVTSAIQTQLGSKVPTSRNLTINGTTYDLSADRTWTIAPGIDGSGTANYVAKWSDTDTLTNSLIYDNGTNVGIGTNSPSYQLTVYKSINDLIPVAAFQNPNAATSASTAIGIVNNVGTNVIVGIHNSNTTSWVNSYGAANEGYIALSSSVSAFNFIGAINTAKSWKFYSSLSPNNTPNFQVHSNGFIAAGVATPSATAHFAGYTSDSSAYALKVDNSSNYEMVSFRNDGFKHFRHAIADLTGFRHESTSSSNSAGIVMNYLVQNGSNMEIGIPNGTAFPYYGTTGQGFIATGLSMGVFNFIHRAGGAWRFWTQNSPNGSTIPAVTINSSQNTGFNVDYSSITARVHIQGSTSDSSAYVFKADNSSSSALLYVRNDGAHAINSSSLVSTAALKVKGRLIVSTQEVTANDNYIAMLEVGVGNGVLFSDSTNGGSTNNQLGYIFGDGGLQIYGRNNASANKFFFSAKSLANRLEFYSDDANTHLKMNYQGIVKYTHTVNNDGFNLIRNNAGTTTAASYSALSVINGDATANRISIIGFTATENTARHGFIAARMIDGSNGDLLLGNKNGGTEQTVLELTSTSSVILGNRAALATTATDGFAYIPSCAGTPTGVPTAITGKIPMVIDSTNNKAYIYSGGAWVTLN